MGRTRKEMKPSKTKGSKAYATPNKRKLPSRKRTLTKFYHPPTSPTPTVTPNILATVDSLLDGPTLDDKIRGKFARKSKDDDQDSDEDASDSGSESDSPPPAPPKKKSCTQKPKNLSPKFASSEKSDGDRNKKKKGKDKTDDDIVSVDDSEDENKNLDPFDRHLTKESKRLAGDVHLRKRFMDLRGDVDMYKRKADEWKALANNKVDSIGNLTHDLEEMEKKLTELERKNAELENKNNQMTSVLTHIRSNPEELYDQVMKKKGSKGSKKGHRKRKSDSSGSSVEVIEQDTGFTAHCKKTMPVVYRTFKFINNKTQEALFMDLMCNNVGKEELIYKDNDTEERKAEVAKTREYYIEEFSTMWMRQLNEHRTYVQVSEKHL